MENSVTVQRFALFNLGFRPFFLGAGVFSILATLVWSGIYVFGLKLQLYGLSPVLWHAHEMIYGYSIAVIAGFLLTAVKNWTGVQTLKGYSLFLLFGLWVVCRVLPFFGGSVPIEAIAALDTLFLALLTLAIAWPILKVKQWRQLLIVSILLLLLASNMLFYLGLLGLISGGEYRGLYSGLYLIVALILTIGRRVIPFFIERGVEYSVELKNRKWLDILSLVVLLLFWAAELALPNASPGALLAGVLFFLHGFRLYGWHTQGIWRKPLLWVLYLAYGFLIVGFGLKFAAFAFEMSPYLAVHAFAFGGIGMVTLGMMCRIALGHTGRNISEPPAVLAWVFLSLFVGAIFRVILPLFDASHYLLWVSLSQGFWIVSFSLFVYVYFPILWQPRVDGRPG